MTARHALALKEQRATTIFRLIPMSVKVFQLMRIATASLVFFSAIACKDSRYSWAYAENLDGSVLPKEYCRQSLTESIYRKDNKPYTSQENAGNVFLFTGRIESYRVVAFHSEDACNLALALRKNRLGN